MYRPVPRFAAEPPAGLDAAVRRAAQTLPLFRCLGASVGAALSGARVRPFRRGDHLAIEGTRHGHVLFLLSGAAKTQKSCIEGRDLIIDIAGPGQAVDLPVDERADGAALTVTALTDGEVLELGSGSLIQAMAEKPSLGVAVAREATVRLDAAHARLAEVAGNTVEMRTVRLILRLLARFGSRSADAKGGTIPLPLSRQDLADLVGTTLETAIRTMSKLARAGLVLTTKDGLVVPDEAALRERCDGRRSRDSARTWTAAA
jgi:CRP/FNR family transcriptional regulator